MDTLLPNLSLQGKMGNGKDPEDPPNPNILQPEKTPRIHGPCFGNSRETEALGQVNLGCSSTPHLFSLGGRISRGDLKTRRGHLCNPFVSLSQSSPAAFQPNIWGATWTPPDSHQNLSRNGLFRHTRNDQSHGVQRG